MTTEGLKFQRFPFIYKMVPRSTRICTSQGSFMWNFWFFSAHSFLVQLNLSFPLMTSLSSHLIFFGTPTPPPPCPSFFSVNCFFFPTWKGPQITFQSPASSFFPLSPVLPLSSFWPGLFILYSSPRQVGPGYFLSSKGYLFFTPRVQRSPGFLPFQVFFYHWLRGFPKLWVLLLARGVLFFVLRHPSFFPPSSFPFLPDLFFLSFPPPPPFFFVIQSNAFFFISLPFSSHAYKVSHPCSISSFPFPFASSVFSCCISLAPPPFIKWIFLFS